MNRVACIILDSAGCGHAPDAAAYGDLGANTLGHLLERVDGLRLPNLAALGLDEVLGYHGRTPLRAGAAAARLTAHAAGKDTTSGHWELMGYTLKEGLATFERFPAEFVLELEARGGVRFLGNEVASGTEILTRLGEEHLRTARPILYTSADSVLQLAAHEEVFGLQRLYDLCQTARGLLDERRMRVGRVIARPFLGDSAANFQRTGNRHDFSCRPEATALNRLQAAGVTVIGVGKIADIFAGSGISESYPAPSNAAGMAEIARVWAQRRESPHFLFANLVDFDALYGHRRDAPGYAQCLRDFDAWLGMFLLQVEPGDLLILTADHGNDPYHPGTDHTREQVPVLTLGLGRAPVDGNFTDVARWVEGYFAERNRHPLPSHHGSN